MNNFADRLKNAIRLRGMTMKEFSEAAGIPYRSVQNYLSASQQPGAEALCKMATTLGISIDWLLLGEGAMQREGSPQPGDIGSDRKSSETLESLLREEEIKFLEELGMRDLVAIASLGKQLRKWPVLQAFQTEYPGAFSIDEIAATLKKQGVTIQLRDIAATITLLVKSGTLLAEGADRYRAAHPMAEWQSADLDNGYQLAALAIKEIASTILPAKVRGDEAKLLTAMVKTRQHVGRKALAEILEHTKTHLRKIGEERGEETLTLVLAFASSDSNR